MRLMLHCRTRRPPTAKQFCLFAAALLAAFGLQGVLAHDAVNAISKASGNSFLSLRGDLLGNLPLAPLALGSEVVPRGYSLRPWPCRRTAGLRCPR